MEESIVIFPDKETKKKAEEIIKEEEEMIRQLKKRYEDISIVPDEWPEFCLSLFGAFAFISCLLSAFYWIFDIDRSPEVCIIFLISLLITGLFLKKEYQDKKKQKQKLSELEDDIRNILNVKSNDMDYHPSYQWEPSDSHLHLKINLDSFLCQGFLFFCSFGNFVSLFLQICHIKLVRSSLRIRNRLNLSVHKIKKMSRLLLGCICKSKKPSLFAGGRCIDLTDKCGSRRPGRWRNQTGCSLNTIKEPESGATDQQLHAHLLLNLFDIVNHFL